MTKRYSILLGEQPAAALAMDSSPQATPGNEVHPRHRYIWGVIIICCSALLLLASLCLCFRRRIFPIFRRRFTTRRSSTKGILKAGELMLRRFQMAEIAKATNNFCEECLLGSGAFGKVYKGTFQVEGALAIKTAHADSYQSVEEFRNEVSLLSKVKHRNLVSLVGFCEERTAGAKVLVYEYVPNGSLLEYIIGRGGRSLTWRQRVNIAIGAAKGIAHLHDGVFPCIIHRDIKPSNILLGDGFEAKVSDFGLVKMGPTGDNSHVSSQVKGTPGYLDPAYCSSFHLSPFSDVYSFGVILLQLVAARPAVDNSRNFHIIEWARPSLEGGNVEEILDVALLTEPCNMEVMLKMGKLGLRCVVKNPKQRPTMTQVWQELERALQYADSSSSASPMDHKSSTENDHSQSFVSMDGVGFQRFHIEMDSLNFAEASMRCFETSSINIDVETKLKRASEQAAGKEEG